MFCFYRKLLKSVHLKNVENIYLNRNHFKYLRTTCKRCDKSVINYEIVEPFHQSHVKRLIPDHILKPNYAVSGVVLKSYNSDLIKTKQQISGITNSCEIAQQILTTVGNYLKSISGEDIDDFVYDLCIANNCYPSPLNYNGFPKCVTTSVNNIAVHGIPDQRKLINGDIITVDVSVYFEGFHGDCAATFMIGDCDQRAQHLVKVAQLCLYQAISVCRDGQKLSIIGKTIEKIAKQNGFNVVPSFCGHGVGTNLHEPPQILHYNNNSNEIMRENMVITIEPVITEGEGDVVIGDDNWTVFTEDNCRTAQFEHTICVKKDKAIILTHYEN